MTTHVFTSVVSNYIPKARVLARSVKQLHPDFVFHLVLVDDPPPNFRLKDEPFDVLVTIEDLGMENPEQWLFTHSLVEACTGVKGFALMSILREASCSQVFYFDPDMVVLAPLDDLVARFGSGSVLLTPHLTEPETTGEAILDNEFSVLQHGIYNLGFVGVKSDAEGRRFAAWWRDRLRDYCFDDIPRGLFTDQRWADLVPAYFPGCVILRDPVYNIATWNLTSRMVEGTPDKPMVGGQRVVFYHFSGFDSGAQEAMLNKYGVHMPVLHALRQWYIAECLRMGHEELSRVPWRYGYFDNGKRITSQHRLLYRDRGDVRHAFPNPYLTLDRGRSYYHWYEADALADNPPVAKPPFTSEYRILLSVTDNDREMAIQTANCLLQNSRGTSELFLAGTSSALEVVLADSVLAAAFRPLDVCGSSSHAANFAAALAGLGERDFIFVEPGIEVPDYWDLRLAWTARWHVGAATVSPLLGVQSPLKDSFDVSDVDQLAYGATNFELLELPGFLEECVYVTSGAAREAGLHASRHDPLICDFEAFLKITQNLRYSHLLADHICVGVSDNAGVAGAPRKGDSAHLRMADVRQNVLSAQPAVGTVRMVDAMRPRQLHIMHSWGGGLERWVREYCRTDNAHTNFVLKSVGIWNAFGMELRLYRHIDDPQPIRVWSIKPAIKGTETLHNAYKAALSEIVQYYAIERILISSLIGHSLDALDTTIPTVMVCHDYFPFCPALNITFQGTCTKCDGGRLALCTRENPHNRFFRNVPPSIWLELRRVFARKVQQSGVLLIAPTPSVRDHYMTLAPELGSAFRIIPHGTISLGSPLALSLSESRQLKILVLGSIAPNKGLALIEQTAPELLKFARLYLIGCGPYGDSFASLPGVTIVEQYRWEDLPAILGKLDPDIALLPSVVPETFSYTLQELNELGIPTLATNIGSFADRIHDGINGFLCPPTAEGIISRLRQIADDRSVLRPIHQRLSNASSRSVCQMIADYDALLPVPQVSSRAYFSADSRRTTTAPQCGRAQLYWRAVNETYTEERSTSASFELKTQKQVLGLHIPERETEIVELRIDFAERPGLLLLHSINLLDPNGKSVWRCDRDRSGIETLMRSGIAVLREQEMDQGALLLLSGGDPHFILPIPSGGKSLLRGGCLTYEFSWRTIEEWRNTLLASDNSTKLSADECDLLLAEPSSSRPERFDGPAGNPEHATLKNDLLASRARVVDLENSLSWRITSPLRALGALGMKRQNSAASPTDNAERPDQRSKKQLGLG